MILYFDLDGVMADFDKGFSKLTGSLLDTVKNGWCDNISDGEWALIRKTPNFWLDLEPMPNATPLYLNWSAYFKKADSIKFLTSAGVDYNAHNQKPIWVDRFIGWPKHETIVVNKRREKIEYAKENILIDDHPETIKWWNDAGGLGIHYTDPIRKAEPLIL